MEQRFQYVSLDTILAKYLRDFKGLEFNEDELIEWSGEALGYMKMAGISEEVVEFVEVRNHQAAIPTGLQYIIQIAKKNDWDMTEPIACDPSQTIVDDFVQVLDTCTGDCLDSWTNQLVPINCYGEIVGDYEVAYYRPYPNLQYEYLGWANTRTTRMGWSNVRLANNVFFSSIVCRTTENEDDLQKLVSNDNGFEYTIVADQLRFSFKEGLVAIAYLRQKTDKETGYPLIPDDESAKAAITYYLGWKTKEREGWNHREGAMQLAQLAEAKWLKYIKQFRNKVKMPFGIDQYEDLMEQSNYVLPRNKRYYGFFGKLGKMENRTFNDPNHTNKYRQIRGVQGYNM